MGPEVVFTTYFTGKVDPQGRNRRWFDPWQRYKAWLRGRRVGAQRDKFGVAGIDDFERMQVWHDSLLKVGCKGVIFHDNLSDWFIKKHQSDSIQFVHYPLTTPRSMNDERYYCYLGYLQENPNIQRAFCLDLFDVEFIRNPFALINDDKYDIYCGGDTGEYNDKMNREKMIDAFGEPHYESEIKLHAGTLGGNRHNLERLMVAMVDTFEQLTQQQIMGNVNMAVYNKCVYDNFDKDRILWGNPLNSRFKAYEVGGDFAIRHK